MSIVIKNSFGSRFRIFKDNDNIEVIGGKTYTIDQIDNIIFESNDAKQIYVMNQLIDAYTYGKNKIQMILTQIRI